MEIAPGIHCVTVPMKREEPGLFPPNAYLVVGTRAAAFVDTGYPKDARVRLDYWRQVGCPKLELIAVSHRHRDHAGGASRIWKATGAPIVCGPGDEDAVNAKLSFGARVDHVARDGAVFDLGGATLELVLAPGHTRGSICVFHREQRTLFTGDNVMGVGSSVINPGEGDIIAYLATMNKLRSYNAAVIYPGHGQPVREVDERLLWLIEHRREREAQIVSALSGGPRTVVGIVKTVYTDVTGRRRLAMARRQVVTQLEKMLREGRVAQDGRAYRMKE